MFKVQSSKSVVNRIRRILAVPHFLAAFFILFAVYCLPLTVLAHGGEDHSEEKKTSTAPANAAAATIVSAERNITSETGQFNIVMRRSPSDARSGETAQFLILLAEKVEGGFGGGAPVPLDNANVSASVTNADGSTVATNLPVKHVEGGSYRTSYPFASSGNYKIVFQVTTQDNRSFSADFPVTVTSAPIRSSFWIGMAALSVLTLGLLGTVFYAAKKRGNVNYKQIVPLAIAAILIFALGTVGLAYLVPPRQTRVIAEIPLNAPMETESDALATTTTLTVPKESQLLFGIKTAPIETRQITGGLKVTGTVRARPDAEAVVLPPVAGKLLFREGLTIGSVVSKGEQVGSVQQVLDTSAQAGLESQRLDVESRRQEVEARNLDLETRRLDLKTALVQLQSQQAEQNSLAQQARIRLEQANRELTRSNNLLEVGAVPKKRVEEAQTGVKLAEQELTLAERQAKKINEQIAVNQSSQNRLKNVEYTPVKINQPQKNFPILAPITGVITDVKTTNGSQVESGTQLMSLVNLTTVLLEAQVFERDLPVVRESTRASFTASALSNEVYNIGTADGDGRLVSIGQTVNEQTRTVSVIYEVKNPINRLRDGMFVEITIDTSGNQKVLTVPKQSVVTEQGQTFVFVFDGGEKFEKRPIAVGTEGADFYEIKSGLKEGERVVTEGIYQLRSTQPS